MKKNTLILFLLLAGAVFLFVPIDRAEAEVWSCGRDAESCMEIPSDSMDGANLKCIERYGYGNYRFFQGECGKFSCDSRKNRICKNPTSWIKDDARAECLSWVGGVENETDLMFNVGSFCPPLTDFGCTRVKGAKCENIKTSRKSYAEEICSGGTVTDGGCQENYACYVTGSDCNNVIAGSLDDATKQCKNFCTEGDGGCIVKSKQRCPVRDFGCYKNDLPCKPIRGDDVSKAALECSAYCGKVYDKCNFFPLKPCPEPVVEKPGPLAGATPEALKALANTNANKAKFGSPVDLINRAIKILMAFIGSISLVLYIWSGFLWITASGNAEQVTKAKTTMVWTTLGVGMMLASYMLASFLFSAIVPK